MRVGLLVAVAVATYLLFPVGAVVESPVFEMGSVATRDVIAPFAFDVPKPADQLARERDDAARSVRPVLVYRADAADSAARRRALQTALRRVDDKLLAPGVTAAGALADVHGEVIVRRDGVEHVVLA